MVSILFLTGIFMFSVAPQVAHANILSGAIQCTPAEGTVTGWQWEFFSDTCYEQTMQVVGRLTGGICWYGGREYATPCPATLWCEQQARTEVDITKCLDKPSVNISASPTSIKEGSTVRISWSGSRDLNFLGLERGNVSCRGSGFNTGGAASGSVNVSPNKSTTYGVTCTNESGSNSDRVLVTVSKPTPAPTTSLSASPSSIIQGDSSTLSWSSSNATSCSGSGFSTGGRTSGSATVSPNNNAIYQVSCSGPGGARTDLVSVQVTSPEISLTSDEERVAEGEQVILRWSGRDVNSCEFSGPGVSFTEAPSNAPGNINGSRSVTITQRSTYTVVCETEGEDINDSVDVKVAIEFEEF